MKTNILDTEANLNKLFPKGNKDRGKALLVFATAKLEERERILKIVKKHCHNWINVANKKKMPCCYAKELEDEIKEKE